MKLRWKLSLAYLFAVLAVVMSVALAVRGTAVDAVNSHMGGSMGDMMADMMGGFDSGVERAVEAGVNQALTTGVVMAGLVGLFAIGAISMWVTRPLGHMAQVASRIAEGDYTQRVIYSARDEIGEFSRAFNEMASQLEETERVRRDLLATISHELRTPLTNIQGYMEGLIDGVLPQDPETLQLVRREAERLSRLVAGIERVARLEAGGEAFEPRVVPVAEFLSQAVASMRPQMEEKDLNLLVDLVEGARVRVDPDKGLQVLNNLLQNAHRYTPPGGSVVVRARPEGQFVRFSVSDTGTGISPADLPHIFERFYRADRSRSKAGGGAGIGLAVVKALVQQMGGRVWAESTMGEGTTVSFVLPQS